MFGAVTTRYPFTTEKDDERPVIMGYELMKRLGLKRGDEIALITGKRDQINGELKPISRKFVVGSFRCGWQEVDARICYTRRSDFRKHIHLLR
ncbi:hypothetical protein UABAM_04683 [Candidatus Uabimicrobium amorphum]|uniref:Molybdopterin dinucleotide-binding domain-containing protein n=2 Tax=Uabimicrobium amorphum TaxID=2596890 RepID=A0A5S9IRB5_UABAM|nr:hypothetical protein UABAM_04683 [Candidatus Uabimicrobium amorphum]